MTAALHWLASSAPAPHWFICIGAFSAFVLAVLVIGGAWLYCLSLTWRAPERDDEIGK